MSPPRNAPVADERARFGAGAPSAASDTQRTAPGQLGERGGGAAREGSGGGTGMEQAPRGAPMGLHKARCCLTGAVGAGLSPSCSPQVGAGWI